MLIEKGNRLVYTFDSHTMWIEPWGNDSFRIRATMNPEMPERYWALVEKEYSQKAEISIVDKIGTIINGKIKAVINSDGRLSIYNEKDYLVLDEYLRDYTGRGEPYLSPLIIKAREFKPKIGADYELSVRFNSLSRDEKIYGMGQYQQENLDLKGCEIELAHRNTQASVPFCISSLGYGFLWNNPSNGRATFGNNYTTWYSCSTDIMDYWVTVGNTPVEILKNYTDVTGTVPMMPDWASGFWQCKLRYRTQEEVLTVARKYKELGVPLSVIIIDYFHWTKEGNWDFDERLFPDPEGMAKELNEMGTKLITSFWPTVQQDSKNYMELLEKGYLIRVERGVRYSMVFRANTIHFDATNPDARKFVWEIAKKNYLDKGVTAFWLDESEPEYTVYDFDNYRYHLGSVLKIGNVFPNNYSQTFYDGMVESGIENPINLTRCIWAGGQRYGALLWSGDIDSTFESLRRQLIAGQNAGVAGISWWTSDIGGFRAGNIHSEEFRELFVRWFTWATFCPVMRLHGWRHPNTEGGLDKDGIHFEGTGADNEIWSYGDDVYKICVKFIDIRNKLQDYTLKYMRISHEAGTPIMRPMFFAFPQDNECFSRVCETQYMYGDDILVAPIVYENTILRTVYLPKGHKWTNVWTKEIFEGGQTIEVEAKIDSIPLFVKDNADVISVF